MAFAARTSRSSLRLCPSCGLTRTPTSTARAVSVREAGPITGRSRNPKRWNTTSSSRAIPSYVEPATKLQPHHGPRATITHTCLNLSLASAGHPAVIGGWLTSKRRASGTLHFFTLSDSSGHVQLVSRDDTISHVLMNLPLESVVLVEGAVKERKAKASSSSGAHSSDVDLVEIDLSRATLLNPALENMPIHTPHNIVSNELRAQYRTLDLRRGELAENLKTRSRVAHIIRCYLHDQGFTEVETPILLNSSPEGAREFLVPTRISSSASPPAFYALQQSPQQPKQLLIASGAVPKYFQIARCFRDEDSRKDRQPEFTQVDLEMAFVEGAKRSLSESLLDRSWGMGGIEVKEVIERLVRTIWKEVKGIEIEKDFRVMPYEVAMDVYGSDKPDTRFDMFTLPIGYYPALSDEALDTILVDQSPYTIEWMITPADQASGLDIGAIAARHDTIDYVRLDPSNLTSWPDESPLTKSLGLKIDQTLASDGRSPKPGDVIWLSRRKKIPEGGWTDLGRLRITLMEALVVTGKMTLPAHPHFLWITQFPLFTRADEDKAFLSRGRWASTHHPFMAPMYEDLEALKQGNVEGVRGQHYDLVLNGQEIGGGSVRIHDAGLQEYVMREVLQLDAEEIRRFSHLLQALRFGAPPHAGIALGFDRLIAILCGAKSIRDVIAFPKTASGHDPVFKSPSGASGEVLGQYGLKALGRDESKVAP